MRIGVEGGGNDEKIKKKKEEKLEKSRNEIQRGLRIKEKKE